MEVIQDQGKDSPKVKTTAKAVGQRKVGFGDMGGALLTSTQSTMGAEIQIFKDNIIEELKSSPNETSCFVIDKKNMPTASYTYVVITVATDANVAYFVAEIEATGPSGVSPSEALHILTHDLPYVIPGAAINSYLAEFIEATLDREYPGKGFVQMDGLIVKKQADITDPDIALLVAKEAINVETIELLCIEGLYDEGSFADTVAEEKYELLTRDTYTNRNATSPLGEIKFTTWRFQHYMVPRKRAILANTENGEQNIVTVMGNVQLVPYRDTSDPHRPSIKIAPLVIVNAVDNTVPSLGMALHSIFVASDMLAERRWVKALAANLRPGKNPGALNKLYTDDKGKPLPPVDLLSSNVSRDTVEDEILQRVEDVPFLALDIAAFGQASAQLITFYIASSNNPGRDEARAAIIQAAHDMSKGEFPLDFDPKAIFAQDAVTLNDGIFISKSKEVTPIDEIDLLFTLAITGKKGMEINQRLMQVELGVGDAQLEKLAILDELKYDTVISGDKYRTFFSGAFLDTLSAAFTKAGLATQIEPANIAGAVDMGFGFASRLVETAQVRGRSSYHGRGSVGGRMPAGYSGLMGRRYR